MFRLPEPRFLPPGRVLAAHAKAEAANAAAKEPSQERSDVQVRGEEFKAAVFQNDDSGRKPMNMQPWNAVPVPPGPLYHLAEPAILQWDDEGIVQATITLIKEMEERSGHDCVMATDASTGIVRGVSLRLLQLLGLTSATSAKCVGRSCGDMIGPGRIQKYEHLTRKLYRLCVKRGKQLCVHDVQRALNNMRHLSRAQRDKQLSAGSLPVPCVAVNYSETLGFFIMEFRVIDCSNANIMLSTHDIVSRDATSVANMVEAFSNTWSMDIARPFRFDVPAVSVPDMLGPIDKLVDTAYMHFLKCLEDDKRAKTRCVTRSSDLLMLAVAASDTTPIEVKRRLEEIFFADL